MKHLGDITLIHGNEIEPVDCIIGGSPCQDLSVAGKRAGLSGERSGLFMEQIRIVKEMRKRYGKPRYMVWENVPGAFSSNNGEDFRAVLEEITKIADETAVIPRPPKGKWSCAGCVMGDGWSVAWRTHDAQFWGVPQRRRRIALIADFGGESAPEILFERESVSGDTESGGEAREAAPGTVETIPAGYDQVLADGGRVPYTLKIRSGCPGGGKGALVQTDKCATLSTLQDQTLFQPVPMAMQAIGEYKLSNVLSSCKARDYKDATDLICAVDCRNSTENPDINGTLQSKPNSGMSLNLQNVVREYSIVRRLTPLECERLQGFPDGWTDIGDWTDSKGKIHKAADAPRYKALGNSIALPFWDWMLHRMAGYLPAGATMGSLFDGIGGFLLLWEKIHGAGTARWASEIEEFAIAVTKSDFRRRAWNERLYRGALQ